MSESLPVLISSARRALDTACSFAEVKAIRDRAEALRVLARSVEAGAEAQNRIAEIKLRAERRLGQELAKVELNAGTRCQLSGGNIVQPPDDAPRLAELGITKSQSSRWQAIARLPEETFEAYLREAAEITSAGAIKLARQLRREAAIVEGTAGDTCRADDLAAIAGTGTKFGTIYADPPWLYGNQATRAATGNHYGGMALDDICALPIADLAADNAHLHLWTTNGFLFDSLRVIEAWGFEYKSCFVWVKPEMGIGNYWRVSHEFLLLGVRGSAPFADRSLKSWGEFERGKHSAKPEQVRQMIERASPGPRLELFARQTAPGWTVWGNQIERNIFYGLAREVA